MIGVIRKQNKEAEEESIKQVHEGLQLLEEVRSKCNKGKAFFNGDSIGYLDIVLGSYMLLLKFAEKIKNVKFLDENKTPRLVTWHECFCLNDAVKNVIPQFDKFFEYVKMRVDGGGAVSLSSTK